MTVLQLMMLMASGFFAYKIYEHIQTLEDGQNNTRRDEYEPSQDEKDEEYVEELEIVSPYSADELVENADNAYEDQDYDKALSLLKEANLKEPQNAEILFKLGFLSTKVGDNTMAIRYYKQSLDVDKYDELVHNSLASVYREENEFASAKMHLNDSLSINDKNPITYFNYGNLMLDMKNEDVAVEMYTKALELDPELKEAKEELEKLQKDQ